MPLKVMRKNILSWKSLNTEYWKIPGEGIQEENGCISPVLLLTCCAGKVQPVQFNVIVRLTMIFVIEIDWDTNVVLEEKYCSSLIF